MGIRDREFGMPGIAGHSIRDLQHELADILALEKLEQGLGKRLETVDDVFARLELTGGHPPGHFPGRMAVAVGIVEADEALHGRAIDEERKVVGRPLDLASCCCIARSRRR